MTDTTERAKLLALADRIDAWANLVSSGYDVPAAGVTMNEAASALRSLAAQDQKPVAHQLRVKDGSYCRIIPDGELEEWKNNWANHLASGHAEIIPLGPLYISPPPAAGWDEALRSLMKAGKIMAVCELCSSSYQEGCGHYDLEDLRETPDGAWVCENCWDGSGDNPIWEDLSHVASLHTTPATTKSAAPVAANASAEARLREAKLTSEELLTSIADQRRRYQTVVLKPDQVDLLLAEIWAERTLRVEATREAFRTGWYINAAEAGDGEDQHPADYLESCEEVDWQDYKRSTLSAHPHAAVEDGEVIDREAYWRGAYERMASRNQELSNAVDSNASSEARLREALTGLQRQSNAAYCRYIDQMSKPECLGFEAKLLSGKFSKIELDAHARAGEMIGAHRALSDAVKQINEALSAHPHASDCDKHGCMGDMAPGDPKDLAELLAKPSVLEPSDRAADVTVDRLADFIVNNGTDIGNHESAHIARALLDAFTVGKRLSDKQGER